MKSPNKAYAEILKRYSFVKRTVYRALGQEGTFYQNSTHTILIAPDSWWLWEWVGDLSKQNPLSRGTESNGINPAQLENHFLRPRPVASPPNPELVKAEAEYLLAVGFVEFPAIPKALFGWCVLFTERHFVYGDFSRKAEWAIPQEGVYPDIEKARDTVYWQVVLDSSTGDWVLADISDEADYEEIAGELGSAPNALTELKAWVNKLLRYQVYYSHESYCSNESPTGDKLMAAFSTREAAEAEISRRDQLFAAWVEKNDGSQLPEEANPDGVCIWVRNTVTGERWVVTDVWEPWEDVR